MSPRHRAGRTRLRMPLRARWHARRWTSGLVVVALVSTGLVVTPVPAAAGPPALAFSKTGPGTVIEGDTARYTFKVTNPSSADGGVAEYNVSFRDTLAPGVSYAAGSTQPADAGDPTISSDPSTGAQTLVWTNLFDVPASGEQSISFGVTPDNSVWPVDSTFEDTGSAYGSTDPRVIPQFSSSGDPIGDPSVLPTSSDTASTTVSALDVTKDEPSPEGKLMRGVHDRTTVYTLQVTNSKRAATDSVVVDDYLPASLEFLGCGGVDNTTTGPEYTGSGDLTATPAVTPAADCPTPTLVETVSTPAGYPAGVYTHIQWHLNTLDAAAVATIKYAAGIPLRQNTVDFGAITPTPESLGQTANLDNNTGPTTRQNGDAVGLTNYVHVSASYSGTVADGGSQVVDVTRQHTVTANDLRVVKTVSPASFAEGAIATYKLTLDSSEYVDDSEITLTDTLPNGLCPLDTIRNYVSNAASDNDCDAGTVGPSVPYQSVTRNSDGTFTIVFDPVALPHYERGDSPLVITFPARMRSSYTGASVAGEPTVNQDSFTNKVVATGTTSPRRFTGESGDATVDDTSSATLTSTGGTLAKLIQPRSADQNCANGGYADPATLTAEQTTFRKGDRICFQVTARFPADNPTRNAVLSDVPPSNLAYEADSYVLGPDNTLPAAQIQFDEDAAVGGQLIWNLGAEQNGVRTVAPKETFQARFSAIVTQSADGSTPVQTSNDAKVRAENTAGEASALRDSAPFSIAAAPPLSIKKSVATVNGSPAQGNADGDHVQVSEGDAVVFDVDVTNDGTAADLTDEPVHSVQTWDVLAPGISCSDVTGITPQGTCTDPGDSGQPSYSGSDTHSAVVWSRPASEIVDPGDTVGYHYTVTIPPGIGVDQDLVDTAYIRSYDADANHDGLDATFYPHDNIDTTVSADDQDAPAASDPSDVYLASVALSKKVSSALNEAGNAGGETAPGAASTQATIGELVTYTVDADQPAHSTVFGGKLVDPLPSGLALVSANAGFSPNAGTAPADQPLPAGADFDAGSLTLTLPSVASNTSDNKQRYEVTVVARVTTSGANLAGTTLPNTATFTSTARPGGGTTPAPVTATANVSVVEPSPSLSKTVDSTSVVGGQRVTYTLTASNAAGASVLHDVWVEDCLPNGLSFDGYGAQTAGSVLAATPGDGTVCASDITQLEWNVGDIAPGDVETLPFSAIVTPSATGSQSYVNHSTLTGTSIAGARSGPADRGAADSRLYTKTSQRTITVQGAQIQKSVTPTSATIGQQVTYTVQAKALANVTYFNASLIDTLPVGIDPASVHLESVSCSASDGTSCPLTSAAPLTPSAQPDGTTKIGFRIGDVIGEPVTRLITLVYTARVADVSAATAGARLVNKAHVAWNNTQQTPVTSAGATFDRATADASATVTVHEPNLSTTKSVSDQTVAPGQTVTYTVVAQNASGANVSAAYDVVVTDDVPANVVVDPATIMDGGTLAGEDGTTGAGGTITWHDDGPVAAGDRLQLTYDAKLAPSAQLTADPQTNSARVTDYDSLATDPHRHYGPSNVANATITPQFPAVAASKSTPDGDTAYLGESFRWRIALTDNGQATAHHVSASDVLPENWTYDNNSAQISVNGGPDQQIDPDISGDTTQTLDWSDLADLAPGASLTITYTATPTNAVIDTPGVGISVDQTNTVTPTAQDATGATENKTGPYGGPDASDSAHIAKADVTMTKATGEQPVAGATGTWTLLVHNDGPDTAVGPFTVIDGFDQPLPAAVTSASAAGSGWTCTTGPITCTRTSPDDVLASGASFPLITITYHVDANVADGTELSNSASVVAHTYDPNTDNNTDNATTTVTTSADLALTKQLISPTLIAGRKATYRISLTNNGPSDAVGPIVVTDTLPDGSTFDSAAGVGWRCADPGTGRTLICTHATGLALNDSTRDLLVTVAIPAGQTADVVNAATITSSGTPDPVSSNNSARVTTPVTTSADLAIQKSHQGTFTAGENALYTLTVTNFGPSTAADATITDTLPTGLSFVASGNADWTCSASGQDVTCSHAGPLPVGAPSEVDLNVHIASSVPAGGVTNTAKVASSTPDPDRTNNSDTDNLAVVDVLTDLQIVKTHTDTPVAGSAFSYQLAVTDNGPSDVAGPITVSDVLPAGMTYVSASGGGFTCLYDDTSRLVACTRDGLTTTEAPVITLTVVIDPDTQAAEIDNTATVRSAAKDKDLSNNSSTDSINVQLDANVTLTKTLDTATPVVAGAPGGVSFTLRASNTGPSDARNVIVADQLPDHLLNPTASGTGWTCVTRGQVVVCVRPVLAADPPGAATPPITVTADVDPDTPIDPVTGTTTVFNTAKITTPTPGTVTNPDPVPVPIVASADLSIDKELLTAPIVAGAHATYSVQVTNHGPSAAAGPFTITDTLPAGSTLVSADGPGWTCDPVSGSTLTCTREAGLEVGASTDLLDVEITVPASQSGPVRNTARITATTTPDPNSANDTDTVTTPVTISADLSIDKSHIGTFTGGTDQSYTLEVTNHGPSDAADARIHDTLPTGLSYVSSGNTDWTCAANGQDVTCEHDDPLPAGSSSSLDLNVLVATSPPDSLTNTASVTSNTPDPDLSNNSDDDPTTLDRSADLAIDKELSTSPLVAGEDATYTIAVKNLGPSDAQGPFAISDPVPDNTTFVSASGTGWTCPAPTGGVLACTHATGLAVGSTTRSLQVTVHIAAGQTAPVSNTAQITSTATPDPNPANDTDSVSATPTTSADLAIQKQHVGTFHVGEPAAYTLTVANYGPSDAADATISDTLPVGLTYLDSGDTSWTCSATGQRVTCDHAGPFPAGTSSVLTLNVQVAADTTASDLSNTAAVSSSTPDPDETNNSDDDNTGDLVRTADLSIDKSHTGTAIAGSPFSYTLRVHNNGPADVTGAITVTDPLPDGLTYDTANPAGGTGWHCAFAAAQNLVTCARTDGLAHDATAPDITVHVIVDADAGPGTIVNTASVKSTFEDDNPDNNSDSDPTQVDVNAAISLTKTLDTATPVLAGTNVSFTLRASNAGPSDARNVVVVDELSPHLQYVSATGDGWACTSHGQLVLCARSRVAAVPPGTAVAPITVVAKVDPATPVDADGNATLTNDARIDTSTPGTVTNPPTVPVPVVARADLAIDKALVIGAITPGSNSTYTVSVSNLGPSTSAGPFSITDTLPASATLVSASGDGWSCDPVSGVTLTCTHAGSLAVGESTKQLRVVLTIDAGHTGPVRNSVHISSVTTPDPNSANDTDTVTATAKAAADLTIQKAHVGTFTAGSNALYTLTVLNFGPSAAADATITDTLPAGLSFVASGDADWTCSASGQVVTCTHADPLPVGVASEVDLNVHIASGTATDSIDNTATVTSSTTDPDETNNSDSDNTGVARSADLAIVKTHAGDATAGEPLSYTLGVTNNGPSDVPAGQVTVSDVIPDGMAYDPSKPADGAGWTCTYTAASALVQCVLSGDLAAGATAPDITIHVIVAPDAGPATIVNTATVKSNIDDNDLTNNADSDPVDVGVDANIALTKKLDTDTPVIAGTDVTFTLQAANTGPSDARAVVVTDNLPNYLTYVSATGTGWKCVAHGQTVVCARTTVLASPPGALTPPITLTAHVDEATPIDPPDGTTTLINTASIVTPSPGTTTNPDPVPVPVVARADLSITKQHVGTFTGGTDHSYRIAVTNNGPSVAADATITDNLPTGLSFLPSGNADWTCTNVGQLVTCAHPDPLAVSETSTLILNVHVGAAPPADGFTNTASVTGDTPDRDKSNNSDDDNTAVNRMADLAIDKELVTSPLIAGNRATYTISVSNGGPSESVGPIVISDDLPPGTTFVSAAGQGWQCDPVSGTTLTCTHADGLAVGASTRNLLVVVKISSGQTATVVNTARITSSATPDPNPDNDVDSARGVPTVSADLAIQKQHVGTFVGGQDHVYTFTVRNNGPSDAVNARITDTLPAGLTYLPSGASDPTPAHDDADWTCSASGQQVTCVHSGKLPAATTSVLDLNVHVVSSPPADGLVNTATVASTSPDPNLTNNTDSDNTAITRVVDLTITKTHSGTATAGRPLSYTLTVGNIGPSDDPGPITATDLLPQGMTYDSANPATGDGWTCNYDSATRLVTCTRSIGLDAGATSDITVNVVIDADTGTTDIVNTATVTSQADDRDLSNNSAQDSVGVGVDSDVSLTKTLAKGTTVPVLAGTNVSFTLTASNAGPSDARAVIVTDTLPEHMDYISASGDGWACTARGQAVLCARPRLPPGTTAPAITITALVDADTPLDADGTATLINTAKITTPTPGTITNPPDLPVPVAAEADLAITKKVSSPIVSAGSNVSYTVAVQNLGPSRSAGPFTITDALPDASTFVSATGTGWSCTDTGSTLTCTHADGLAVGATTEQLSVVVKLASSQRDIVVNVARISKTTTPDPNPDNDVDSVRSTPTVSADLAIQKQHDGTFVGGTERTYALTVVNYGPADAVRPVITDTLPDQLSYRSSGDADWTCSATGQKVTCTHSGPLAAGATSVLTLNVHVVSDPPSGGLINSATVVSPTGDPDLSNNTDDDNTDVSRVVDLAITKSHTGDAIAGQPLSYRLGVQNLGTSDDPGPVVVNDPLPAGMTFTSASGTGWLCNYDSSTRLITCARPSLAGGATAPDITITVGIDPDAGPATIVNTATVRSDTADSNLTNNSASDPADVGVQGAVSLTKSLDTATPVLIGTRAAFTLTASNAGPSDARNVVVADPLPAHLSYVSASGDGWKCTDRGQAVLCARGVIAAGTTAPPITLITMVDPATPVAADGTATLQNGARIVTSTPGTVTNPPDVDVPVVARADLAIHKTLLSSNLVAGTQASYSIGMTNLGPSDSAGPIEITDTLPASTTLVSATGSGWTCAPPDATTLTCTYAAGLSVGSASPELRVTVLIDPAHTGTVRNTVTISQTTTPDPNDANDSDSATGVASASADLAIQKQHEGTFIAGTDRSYVLMVANNGPSEADAVKITDSLPAELRFLSSGNADWACTAAGQLVTCTHQGPLAAGATSTVTLNVHVVSDPPESGLVNSASVSSGTPDPVPANNTDDDNTGIDRVADLSIDKSHDGAAIAGSPLTYHLDVTNNGPSGVPAGQVLVSDVLPAGLTYVSATGDGWTCHYASNTRLLSCTLAGTLANGAAAARIAVHVTIDSDEGSATIVNTASVSSDTYDNNLANNSDSDPTDVGVEADVTLTKTLDTATPVIAGQNVTFTLQASNAGPSDARGIVVSDVLSSHLDYVSAGGDGWACAAHGQTVLCARVSIPAGTSAPPITLVAQVDPATPIDPPDATTVLVNTATIHTGTPGTIVNPPAVRIPVVTRADLSIDKSHTATFTGGSDAAYTLKVTNHGPSEAANATITDDLPAGLSYVSSGNADWTCAAAGAAVSCTRADPLPNGASTSLVLNVHVDPSPPAHIVNTASVTGDTPDPVPANNSDDDSVDTVRSADLAITKQHMGTFTGGADAQYLLTVTNNGPSDAANATISDTLPDGLTYLASGDADWTCAATGAAITCTHAAPLPLGAVDKLQLNVHVDPDPPATLVNTASVTSATPDPDHDNNQASDSTKLQHIADLEIDKKLVTSPLVAGQRASYTVSITNHGPSATAGPFTITDALPASTTFVSASGTGWDCSATDPHAVTCTHAAGLAVGASTDPVTVIVDVPSGQTGNLVNTARITTTTTPDPNPDNDASTVTTPVTASADLSIQKQHEGTFTAGTDRSYRLTVTNNGPSDAADATIVDTLPAELTYQPSGGGAWACSALGQKVTCLHAGPIPADTSTALVLNVHVVSDPPGSGLVNTASVSSSTSDPDHTNNTDSDNTAVNRAADLSIDKELVSGALVAGTRATYTAAVTNLGPSASAGPFTVTDALPAGTTFVAASGPAWSCDPVAGATLTCTHATGLDVGEATRILRVTVDVGAGTKGAVTNTAKITATTTPDPNPANDSDSVTATPSTSADLLLQKEHVGTFVGGESHEYTLTVLNNGPSDAADATITDTLPDGLTYQPSGADAASPADQDTDWSCSAKGQAVTCVHSGTLPNGATSVLHLHVEVASTPPADGLTNTATVSSSTPDPVPGNNTDDDNTSINLSADLAITKHHTGDATAGAPLSYTLSVVNNGPSDVPGAVVVNDPIPAAMSYTSASGDGWTCSYDTSERLVTCTLDGLAHGVTAPDITLDVVVDSDAGPATIVNTAVVHSAATLRPAVATRSARAAAIDPAADPATVAVPDPVLSNNISRDPTQIDVDANLALTKTLDTPTPVLAGDGASFTLQASNAGPSDARGVVVADPLPAHLDYISAAGTGWTCAAKGQAVVCARATLAAHTNAPPITVTTRVDPAVPTNAKGETTLINNARIGSPSPGTTRQPGPVPVPVVTRARLTMTKTASHSPVTAGQTFTWTMRLHNNGPSSALAPLTITDLLPAYERYARAAAPWTCTAAPPPATPSQRQKVNCIAAADLPPDSDAPPLVMRVHLDPTAPTGTQRNTAVGSSPTPGSDGTGAGTITVARAATLQITKTHIGTPEIGKDLDFTLLVHNTGPSAADQVVVTDPLPAGLDYVTATGTGWTCSLDHRTLTCHLAGTLAPRADASPITLRVRLAGAAYPSVTNVATVFSTDPDVPGRDSDSDRVVVGANPVLSLDKEHEGRFTAGGTGTYDLVVTNTGTTATTQPLELSDPLPDGEQFVSAHGPGWTCTNNDNTVTCRHPGPLGAGESSTVTLVVSLDDDAPQRETNTATVTEAGGAGASSTDVAPVAGGPSGGGGTGATIASTGVPVLGLLADALALIALGMLALLAGLRRRRRA